jgi:hypothetical protein
VSDQYESIIMTDLRTEKLIVECDKQLKRIVIIQRETQHPQLERDELSMLLT